MAIFADVLTWLDAHRIDVLGALASILSLIAIGGWWRVRRLVRKDRERAMRLRNPYETYARVVHAVTVMGDLSEEGPSKERLQMARDGLLKSCGNFELAFKVAHTFSYNSERSLLHIADDHYLHGDVKWAAAIYELAYKLLKAEVEASASSDLRHGWQRDLEACIGGLQECARHNQNRKAARHWLAVAKNYDVRPRLDEAAIDNPSFETGGFFQRLQSKYRSLKRPLIERGSRLQGDEFP